MKRLIIPVLIVALAVTAFLFRDRWLPQPPGQFNYLGYVEGETTLVGTPQAGRLVSVEAVKGQEVHKGAVLFTLDPAQFRAEVARAEGAVATARATRANLLTGKRPEEIEIIRAQIAQAEASLALAQKELTRAATLASSGTAAQSRLDQAQEQVKLYEQRLVELKASEQVASLPARGAEIDAATSRVAEAEAQLAQAKEKLADLSPVAPADARVDDVFFKPGEWVAAGQPVVALLKPSDVTLRFFVPETVLAGAQPGRAIQFRCDGCAGLNTAVISHVASQPEYTPPVIYSETARSKLVYLVEAKPDAANPQLRPGLPIEVEPLK
ncbi:secretion protein HlyD [Aestuariivirga litoralis]|uniref:Secretion protein HlyD n=1 Tax=Aestuariivirga litoralis TaxID=2650924 RepID=A0A2W2ALV0_9HYPH|nr:HlyD family efflux transporter periplasmic adaptor subunit [Aestuariivirga litoralis]PZF76371.1 secretion protein HlyD [Aestuariivirga litoralis]